MVWKQHKMKPIIVIVRTSILLSLTTYVIFWSADVIQPGFVSRYFSVHIFLFSAIIFGAWWSWMMEDYVEWPWLHVLVALTFGVVGAMLTWGLTEDLGVYRLLVSLIAGVTPVVAYLLIKS